MPRTKKPPVRNRKLLLRIARQIENHPEEYNQGMWWGSSPQPTAGCGTTACIAGWAVTLDKYGTVSALEKARRWYERYLGGGDGVILRATKALGITPFEADILFNGFWKPRPPLTVPQALRALAGGANIHDVTVSGLNVFLDLPSEPEQAWSVAP